MRQTMRGRSVSRSRSARARQAVAEAAPFGVHLVEEVEVVHSMGPPEGNSERAHPSCGLAFAFAGGRRLPASAHQRSGWPENGSRVPRATHRAEITGESWFVHHP